MYITGHLRTNTSLPISNLIIFVKGDNKVLAQTGSDAKGDFYMSFTPNKEKSFDFYCFGAGTDTLLIKSVTGFDSDQPDIIFSIPAQVKRTSSGKIICPKCKTASKVYRIKYTATPVYVKEISTSGDTAYNPIYKGFYQAGTDVAGAATYYCDRDKVRF